MTDTTNINPTTTVEQFRNSLMDSNKFAPGTSSARYFECDFCSTGVPYQSHPRVASYFADDVLNSTHPQWQQVADRRPLTPLATYCEDCAHPLLYFPCHGVAEARVLYDLGEDRTVSDVEVEDISPRDDGIPWRPDEFVERISGVSFNKWTTTHDGPGHLWGPENIVTIFMSYGPEMDITEIVQYDGSLDPHRLGQARKAYQEFVKKMRKPDYNRLSYRDYLRDDN